MAYVEKRGKNKWRLNVVIGYTPEGKAIPKRKTVEAKNKTEAKQKLSEFEVEVLGGTYFEPAKISLEEFYHHHWLDKYANDPDSLSHDTRRDYIQVMETRVLPKYGHMKLADIKTIHILDYLSDLKKPNGVRLDGKPGPLSSSRISNCFKAFKNVLQRAVDWKFIKENPADAVDRPKAKSEKTDVYSEEEIDYIFNRLNNYSFIWQVLIPLAFVTGAREGELAALEEKHINLEKPSIYIEQTIVEVKGEGVVVNDSTKTERTRHISIPKFMAILLKKLIHIRKQEKFQAGSQWEWGDHLFLFGNEVGKPIRPDSISQWWRRFTQKQNIKHIRFHSLRHSSATHLINKGVHAKVIQERLGHTKMDTTMSIYAHVIEEADQKSAAHFNSFFEDKTVGGNSKI
ncbi:tyrosine-type recombinase/integrase [Bacillus paralicheniformis]|uniref:tyrosine-type recombinase/integrase n=1 Tax=Bacillus paralicheniformis TaxID=1648923 RepID=UPI00189E5361|nr:tyrosine-type recombinase/integrase [Bacillus paralicheniformis]